MSSEHGNGTTKRGSAGLVRRMPELDDAGIRQYLLGLLPETEVEALEAAYLTHPELRARVLGVESVLLQDHAAGRLPPGESEALERRYHVAAPGPPPAVSTTK
ncbi:MAG TPA: hypothetical protein VII13_17520 [Vicinamibacteria bacterium]|jgi:hypothetical protein